ncbi:hypothetical protein J8L70_10220 [Pseudoalteromonas sp. MMG010]|uniref:hypothetical protein n=1 Tax=Pseudoalteromonas sp. MMG010 TaxID=2822685 RepID=UPI001B39D136|nr:hypothetical protein [Pseudoalteromonas sp. MMG010]MBQ4833615.1 hypothetical protein [Pseudoalteromonas sp. MMG010]
MDKIKQKNLTITICIIALLILPLIETMSNGTLWGINLISPSFMAQVSGYLLIIKLVFVSLGLVGLALKAQTINAVIKARYLRVMFYLCAGFIGIVQIVFISLGALLNPLFSSSVGYIHKQFNIEGRTFYVYTADPGAMGRAYHYVYLQCPLALSRYELKTIAKVGWMKDYSLEIHNNNLTIHHSQSDKPIPSFDLTHITCTN